MMKILHIGITVYNEPIWLQKAFHKTSECLDLRPETPDPVILQKFHEFKPDLVFIQVQSPGIINTSVVANMSKSALVINWMGDVRVRLEKWFYDWKPYVVNCFSNMRDVQATGGEYLQIGIDPEIFYDRKKEKVHSIVFMANRYNTFPLSRYREQIISKLKQVYNGKFKILGTGWRQPDGNLNSSQVAESEYYSACKIGISISHFAISRYFSDRLLRIMGSGCFCLSHYYPDMEKDFTIGEHLDVFRDENELIQKINYYLENEEERQQIAKNGYDHVHRNFTCNNMVSDVLRIYNEIQLQ